jgi:hypothetical protein
MPLRIDMPSASTLRRIRQVQVFTVAWMSVEAAVSLKAAFTAKRPALLAFGGDSAIELVSAALVLWRFRGHELTETPERRVNRRRASLPVCGVCGCSLGVLVARSPRTETQLHRNRRFDCRRDCDASAGTREEEAVSSNWECRGSEPMLRNRRSADICRSLRWWGLESMPSGTSIGLTQLRLSP